MKCPSCGKENPAGEQYCLDCGTDLSAAAPAASTPAPAAATPAGAAGQNPRSFAMSDDEFQKMLSTPPAQSGAASSASAPAEATPATCPHCGAPAPRGGSFCDNCGEPLSAAPAAAPAAGAAAGAAPTPGAQDAPTAAIADGSAPAAAAAPAVSFDLSGPAASSSYLMGSDDVKIGRRDAESGIFPEIDFDGNDIVVDNGERVHAVSRRHGHIFRDAGVLKFEDLGSTNGSTLNGAAVLAHDPQPLKDGDTVVLGRTCRITVHVA